MHLSFKFLLICLFIATGLQAQHIPISWQHCYGGNDYDSGNAIVATPDGGYAIGGSTVSNDGDVTQSIGGYDFWLVKTDAGGAIEWQHCYGSTNGDWINSMLYTTDGGYIMAGNTYGTDSDATGNHGQQDILIIKTDSNGVEQWRHCYGGSRSDVPQKIIPTADGGYVIVAATYSDDGDVSGNHNLGTTDIWVLKINSTGAMVWSHYYGGNDFDNPYDVIQTADGGYMIAAETYSTDGDVTTNAGLSDMWLLKLNDTGNLQWQKTYGGAHADRAACLAHISGGYIISGYSDTADNTHSGCLLNIDENGNQSWLQRYNGNNSALVKVFEASDGYVAIGRDSMNNATNLNVWMVHTDNNGSIKWQQEYGGSYYEEAADAVQTDDTTYTIVGYTNSNSGDVSGLHTGEPPISTDMWAFKAKAGKQQVSAVPQLVTTSDFSLCPNPATTTLMLKMAGMQGDNTVMLVRNSLGETIIQKNITPTETSINITTLPPGVYYVTVNSTTRSFIKR